MTKKLTPSEPTPPKASDILGVSEAAEVIGVSRQSIERFILNRRVPAKRTKAGKMEIWLLRRGDLDYYVANREKGGRSRLPEGYVNTNELPSETAGLIETPHG